jgi:hypothetical protein
MLRARWRLTLAISVVVLECTWGGFNDSGQSCPSEPAPTPLTDCSPSITALTLAMAADTIEVGRGALLTGQITDPSAPAVGCFYSATVSSSDWTIAGLLSLSATWSSNGPGFGAMPISAVIAHNPGTARITLTGGAVSSTVSLTVIPVSDAFVAVSAGDYGACTLDSAGRAYCSSASMSTAPLLLGGLPALAAVDAGPVQVCGLSAGKQVFCWPNIWYFPALSTPSQVELPADAAVVDASGIGHACALTTAHDAYCWGSNWSGQLGAPGDNSYQAASGNPVAVVGGHKFQRISAGGNHTCGLGDDGSLWCWGSNASGELGVTADTAGCPAGLCQASPARVRLAADSLFTDVATGYDHTCALDTAGAAYCWGRNSTGALGTADTLSSSTPRKVAGSLTFTSLTAGLQYSCGLTASGDAYCWGLNASGQLGSGPSSNSCASLYSTAPCETAPVKVSGSLRFSSLNAGTGMTCGMASDGAWCWGNLWGSGGMSSSVPVRVPGQR